MKSRENQINSEVRATVLRVKHLDVTVSSNSRGLFGRQMPVKIIDDVSIELKRDRNYGLVGESGSGKSTLGRALIGVQGGVSGEIQLGEIEVPPKTRESERLIRQTAQMIFQNPLGSFDPRQTIRESLIEALRVNGLLDGNVSTKLAELMESVGLPVNVLESSPTRLSGGQRQRAAIARALSLEPEIIVADEPFAALDVTTQAKVVSIMAQLQKERGLTQLVISHDLSLIDLICDEVFVMYLGSIVESGPAELLAAHAAHPYTAALRSAIPVPDPIVQKQRERILLAGDPPGPAARPPGCAFHPRCPIAKELCSRERPELRPVGGGQMVACHFAEQVLESGVASLRGVSRVA